MPGLVPKTLKHVEGREADVLHLLIQAADFGAGVRHVDER
jgi:hypothetical protein